MKKTKETNEMKEEEIAVEKEALKYVTDKIVEFTKISKAEMEKLPVKERQLKADLMRGLRKKRYLSYGIKAADNLLDLLFLINAEEAIYFYKQYLKKDNYEKKK